MSDETNESIIKRITVEFPEPKLINGGHRVKTFFDCIRLTPTELARLAAQCVGDLPIEFFDMAIGVAYTGILFGGAVAGGREVGILTEDGNFIGPELKGKKVLLVDDVIVQGAKVQKARTVVESLGATVVGYACIVSRVSTKNLSLPIFAAHSE